MLRQLTILPTYTRELRAMQDGGCIALDWWQDHKEAARFAPTTPIVLVLHGLCGLLRAQLLCLALMSCPTACQPASACAASGLAHS